MKKKSKPKLHFESENLAFPEIRTGKAEAPESDPEVITPADDGKPSIQFDTVAVPEIKLSKKKEE